MPRRTRQNKKGPCEDEQIEKKIKKKKKKRSHSPANDIERAPVPTRGMPPAPIGTAPVGEDDGSEMVNTAPSTSEGS